MRIKPMGLAGNFWQAEYWFSETDSAFLRYKVVYSGPGTPPTIKELVSP